MENESLIDWLDWLGYPINESEKERVLDVFSSLSTWFGNYGMQFLLPGDSLKNEKTILSDEFGSILNADISPFFQKMAALNNRNQASGDVQRDGFDRSFSLAGVDDFLKHPVSVQTFYEKLDIRHDEEKGGLNDTFVQLVESSVRRFSQSGQYPREIAQTVEDSPDSSSARFVGKPAELNEEADDRDERSGSGSARSFQDGFDAASAFHLKMPPDDFLEMNRTNPLETAEGLRSGASSVSRTHTDSENTVFSAERVQKILASLMDVSSLNKFGNRISPGLRKENLSGKESDVDPFGNRDEIFRADTPLAELLQANIDKRRLMETFFDGDTGLSGLDENVMSFGQKWVPDQLMDGKKLLDAMTVRQWDRAVLGLPESPMLQEKPDRPESSEADASNRTINITVNGTGSSRETRDAISQGLLDVDMGMTLRHFKSPMMA